MKASSARGVTAMPDTLTTNSPIIAGYRAATPGSAAASEKASRLFPSGVTHDSRYIEPYGLYITRAQGPRKWDVDGNCYVDYFGGHGALLLGHSHPKIVEAVKQQIERGTHFGASHETEIAWAEWVLKLVPSAERVRFTSSGTEATLMAVRLARAFTGKSKLIRFKHHFHGWHDHMTSGYASHFDGSPTPGVLSGVAGGLLLAEQNDAEGLARLLDENKDIAAAIIEPTGAHGARLPIGPKFLVALRELTRQHGVGLIFNEVFEEEQVPWAAYGMFSNFHIFTNPHHRTIVPTRFNALEQPAETLAGNRQAGVVHKLRLAMMTGGVDFSGSPGGIVSATHGEAELEDTLNAVRKTLRML